MNTLSVCYDMGMIVLASIIASVIIDDSQPLAAVAGILALGHLLHFVSTVIDYATSRS